MCQSFDDKLIQENEHLRRQLSEKGTELEKMRADQRELWYAVAHALRTPLQVLVGFAGMIEPGLPFPKLTRYLDAILREADRLAQVVDGIQQQVELESGALSFAPEATALEEILLDAVRQCEEQAPDRMVLVECPDDLPPVVANAGRVRQVLESLLKNVMQASPEGGPIQVTAGAWPDLGQVVMAVRADGPAMPADDQAAVFERFLKSPSAPGDGPRRGPGLYVARQIARRLGGDITFVESDPERGNTFSFWLPLCSGEVVTLEVRNEKCSGD
jgi:two-component system phosphate regulon sensor histidine kinase PhoR